MTTTTRVPVSTRMFDDTGNLSRTWVLFFEEAAAQDPAIGAVVTLPVEGTLAIGSNMAPIGALLSSRRATGVAAFLKEASVGDDVTFTITVDGVDWLTLTIAEGDVAVNAAAADVTAAGTVAGNKAIGLDLSEVGTTFPGSDLSVFIYF